MSRETWILGAGLAAVGLGCAFSTVHSLRLEVQVGELEQKMRDQTYLFVQSIRERQASETGAAERNRPDPREQEHSARPDSGEPGTNSDLRAAILTTAEDAEAEPAAAAAAGSR